MRWRDGLGDGLDPNGGGSLNHKATDMSCESQYGGHGSPMKPNENTSENMGGKERQQALRS